MTTSGKHAREGASKTKKRALALAALAMCCALMAGGTLAYFTAEERAHNVITSGDVDIALNEYTLEGGQLVPFPVEEGVGGVMPGSAVDKLVEVENTGASDAWVRVKVTKAVTLAEGVEHEVDLSLIQMDFNEADWEQSGGWWYYRQPLPAKADGSNAHVTPYLFTKVTFAGAEMGNPYQGAEITINVQAEAVQVANNGTSALTASGWPTA